MQFSAKSNLMFEPRAAVDMATAEVAHKTPVEWRPSLGGMAAINGVRGELKYKLTTAGGAGTAEADISLKTSQGQVIHTESITIANDAVKHGRTVVDVGAVSGGSLLYMEVEVTAGVASMTAELDAVLDLETPVVFGGC